MIPYTPTTQPMTGDDQQALVKVFERYGWYGPGHRLTLANQIIAAGFRRTVPRKVTRLQLWSYSIETALLVLCAILVFGHGLPFVYGILVALAFGSAATLAGAFTINHAIKKGFRP